MIWIFLGPPGAGKGTQAKLLAADLGIEHVSTGDLLRKAIDADTELGRKAKSYMERGELVPDALLLGLVRETLEGPARRGCILDGFPRNLAQAEALGRMAQEVGHAITGVLEMQVPEQVLVDRIAKRAAAEGRPDDSVATVRHRLRVYSEQTAPLVEYYRTRGALQSISGEGSIEDIQARIRVLTRDGRGAP